jgi:membrane protein DedA with SNARE-associated domain
VDVVRLFDLCLHSLWLLPVLVVMIAADGPLPVLPSETLLVSATAAAFGVGDGRGVLGLGLAALLGSVAGDLLVFALGRSSKRLLPIAAHADSGLAHWVRANLHRRPVVALVGARMLPAGRLVSTAAAGRVGLPVPAFLAGSLASSAVWSVYMLAVGMLLGPIVDGNPFLSLAAGVVMAVLTAGGFALVTRLRARRRARVTAATTPPAPVGPAVPAAAFRAADAAPATS